RRPEVGPEQPGPGEAEMRGDQQPVDLLIAIVGESEDRPVGIALSLLRADLDAADDAVGARRGRYLDLVVGLREKLDLAGQVQRPAVEGYADRLKRRRAGACQRG